MASFRARAVNSVLRHRVKRRLAACATPLEARKVFQATRLPLPFGVRFTPLRSAASPGNGRNRKGAGRRDALLSARRRLYRHVA